MGKLVLVDAGRGRTVPLAGRVRFGRDEECEIVVDDAKASRRHAEIAMENGGCVLRDLGSRNGTRVNGRRLEGAHRLAAGDEIAIGAARYVVRAAGAAVSAPAAPEKGPSPVAWILTHAVLLAFFAGCAWLSRWGFGLLLSRWAEHG